MAPILPERVRDDDRLIGQLLGQLGATEVTANVRGALDTIGKNEEFINMVLAMLMTPE
ncbi:MULTISPECIES: hypothetical protein [Pseudomonas]|uniref:Uncharacterized protein n=1 Tax=Pseudomonas wuhanensis TaxID=2954098 RepID=A0ABY9GUB7_9PSED|nr:MULTISPECIES: hypothetical protein [unclassified Pseudomonas]WLI13452.1 hypothetical protein PSH65_04640 [Pseudomonas sp. FP603]WLI19339.1 hypothetical protein PSH88_04640 [Pseudomonas sp. FP607]